MGYDTSNLRGDLSGGFVAGIIALPLALAFGVQSGLGAAAGLYGAIAVGIFAAALGGTATQASGPTGPMTVVSASIVAYAIDQTGSIEAGLGIALLSFFVGGALQVGLGLLRIGKYVKYFPYPVVSGFMSGVGLIIIFLQIWPLLGSKSPKSTIEVFTRIGEPLADLNVAAVALGLLTLAVNYAFPYVTKKVPSVLVALIVGTGAALLSGADVPTIGSLPNGIPAVQIGAMLQVDPAHFSFILQSGVTLALLGSIDSLLTSVIADNLTGDKHDSNRELFGQGVGNMIAAVFGGIPGAGATKGTVVAINAGARTRLSGVTHGLFQGLVLLGLGGFAAYIPLCVLAGLLISVGVAIIDKKGIRHLRYVPKADGAVMLVVLVWTVFGNLVNAVAAGIVLASVLFMKKASDLAESKTSLDPLAPPVSVEEPPWDDERDTGVPERPDVFVKHLYGPLFFGFSSGFRELSETLPEGTRVLVMRMERVPYMDQSGLYALEETLLRLRDLGTTVVLTGVADQPLGMLERIAIVPNLVPEEHVFPTFDACVAWLETAEGASA
jgi:SulP family sulfate permease